MLNYQRWAISKFTESYLKWKLPLKKYGIVPNTSFLQDLSSCQLGMLPEHFFEKVEEGSIILKKAKGFKFFKEGLIFDGETKIVETDVVILATGFRGDEKLRNMLKSPIFQKIIKNEPTASIVPLYRCLLIITIWFKRII